MDLEKVKEYLAGCISFPQWQEVGIYHHHGYCIPLFSLRSLNSCGIGEFYDLFPFIDFCKATGMDVIQLLPLNDRKENDPSPYNPLSSSALDPIYLSFHALPFLDDTAKERIKKLKRLTTSRRVNYFKVRKEKENFLKDYFKANFKKFEKETHFPTFLRQNSSWLADYALFKVLREKNKRKRWSLWKEKYLSEEEKKKLLEEYKSQVNFYFLLQYLCFHQAVRVKEYASKNKVFIMADIPILVAHQSSDTWSQPHLFNFSLVAGAPPDDFNALGHKWNFPLFNWEKIKEEDFTFWKRRINIASAYSHLFRIDHAVGFFRIWAIDLEKAAATGRFFPKDPSTWLERGKSFFEMLIQSSSILPIAEDLGMIPPFVYTVLKELGICGMKVMRWQKNSRGNFLNPKKYEPISLTTVSTHDTETMQLWWQNSKNAKTLAKSKGWQYEPYLSHDKRYEILKDSHTSASLFHVNLLPEYLALFPELISKKAEDERINISGVKSSKNWTYKIQVNIEELLQNQKLKERLESLKM